VLGKKGRLEWWRKEKRSTKCAKNGSTIGGKPKKTENTCGLKGSAGDQAGESKQQKKKRSTEEGQIGYTIAVHLGDADCRKDEGNQRGQGGA